MQSHNRISKPLDRYEFRRNMFFNKARCLIRVKYLHFSDYPAFQA